MKQTKLSQLCTTRCPEKHIEAPEAPSQLALSRRRWRLLLPWQTFPERVVSPIVLEQESKHQSAQAHERQPQGLLGERPPPGGLVFFLSGPYFRPRRCIMRPLRCRSLSTLQTAVAAIAC